MMKKIFTKIALGTALGMLPFMVTAVETSRTEATDPGQEANELLQDGIVEEVSAEDLEYYGIVEDGASDSRFPVRAKLRVEGFYDSNIFLASSGETDDFIWEFQPDIYFETGSGEADHYFSFGYDPTFVLFMDNTSENAANHSGYAKYNYNGDKLTFGAQHRSATITGANNDVGIRVTRDEHITTLNAEYDISEKFLLEASANQSLRFYETLNNYHDWTADLFGLYQVMPKLKIGVGPKIGFVDIQGSPNQSYQQALARFIYDPSAKFQINGSAGVEFRQYQGPLGWEDRVTPAASLGFAWLPFDGTNVSGTIYRNISPSVSIVGSNYIATGVRAKVRQRLFQKVFYNLSGKFEHAEYRPTVVGTVNDRRDNYFSIRNSFDYDVFKHGSVSVYHMYEDNSAQKSPSDFDRHVVGVQLNLEY